MRFSRFILFYLLLSFASIISTNLMAGDFDEEYLKSHPTYDASNHYGIMEGKGFSQEWNEFVSSYHTITIEGKSKLKLRANDRLSAATWVTQSYHHLAGKTDILKDKNAAHHLSKRMLTASQLASGDGIKVAGPASDSSNLAYLRIALTQGGDLAALKTGLKKSLEHIDALSLLANNFSFDLYSGLYINSRPKNPENVLRSQLTALAFYGYYRLTCLNIIDPFTEAFTAIKSIYPEFSTIESGLRSIVTRYSNTINLLIKKLTPTIEGKSMGNNTLRKIYERATVSEKKGRSSTSIDSLPIGTLSKLELLPYIFSEKSSIDISSLNLMFTAALKDGHNIDNLLSMVFNPISSSSSSYPASWSSTSSSISILSSFSFSSSSPSISSLSSLSYPTSSASSISYPWRLVVRTVNIQAKVDLLTQGWLGVLRIVTL